LIDGSFDQGLVVDRVSLAVKAYLWFA
jgi:hypothetical protein